MQRNASQKIEYHEFDDYCLMLIKNEKSSFSKNISSDQFKKVSGSEKYVHLDTQCLVVAP